VASGSSAILLSLAVASRVLPSAPPALPPVPNAVPPVPLSRPPVPTATTASWPLSGSPLDDDKQAAIMRKQAESRQKPVVAGLV
jgi:hypothetical protein